MNDYEEIVKEYPRGRRMEYPNQSTSKEPAEESRADRSKEHHQSEFRSLIVETKMAISSLSLTFTSTTLPNQVTFISCSIYFSSFLSFLTKFLNFLFIS